MVLYGENGISRIPADAALTAANLEAVMELSLKDLPDLSVIAISKYEEKGTDAGMVHVRTDSSVVASDDLTSYFFAGKKLHPKREDYWILCIQF